MTSPRGRLPAFGLIATLMSLMMMSLATAGPVGASHYRSTQLTWDKTGPTTAVFTATASWRCNFFALDCDSTPSPAGTTFFADPITFGDGTFSNGQWTVVSIDSANNVVNARTTATKTYATPGPWLAFVESCCRLSPPLHRNNPDVGVRVETRVDFLNATGSPESAISPIVDCAKEAVCQFFVPATDPDGRQLVWRFSSSSEATAPGTGTFVQPGPVRAPNAATVDPATGLYRWDTTGANLNLTGDSYYSTQVTIESRNATGGVVSKVAVDFFIRLLDTTNNQPPVFDGPTPADGTTYNVAAGSLVSFAIQATDPNLADTVSLTVLGIPAGATFTAVASNPATGNFSWTPTAGGSTILTLTAADQNGAQATQRSVTINVISNQPPTSGAGGPYTGIEGSPIAISGTATDPDVGDTVTTAWTVTGAGNDAGASCAVAAPASLTTTVTCNDDGNYTLTLTATDDDGATAVSNASLTVGNVPPSIAISAPLDGAIFPINSLVNLNAAVSDPGANDDPLNCRVNWDDGVGTVASGAGANGGTCSASKTFSATGVYTITAFVDDGDGAVASDTVMIVVYDPSAGFVTGGGWIDSPAGAYLADPSLSGRANFGFVSKYKKGVTVPDGQTQFQFQAAGLNVHSDAYQWLVVAGSKAQFKGTGTLNGVAGHGFLLTAYDGGKSGVDRFRIKISDASGTVYDNNVAASDDLDTANPQNIAGGSIVIHR